VLIVDIFQFFDDLPKVWAGQIEIQQVVLNFLTNAIKPIVDEKTPNA